MEIDRDLLVVIKAAEFTGGEMDLGEKLMGLFLKVLSDSERLPARIIFLGSGIFLTTEGTPLLDRLKALEEHGTEIVSCITCLSYYGRRDRLAVGREGDMRNTVDSMLGFSKVLVL